LFQKLNDRLGLRGRLCLESSFCDPMFWLWRALEFRGMVFVGGDHLIESQGDQIQNQRLGEGGRSPQHLLKVCDRLSLASVSKAGRLFRLAQAAVSGVALLRSCVLVVKGDRFSERWFLWRAIVGLSHRAIEAKTRP
jgi:hypothetical protein